VAGVLLVGLGCELITPELIAEKLCRTGQRVETVNIQDEGGTTGAVAAGCDLVETLLREAADLKRQSVEVSNLVVGTQCGGSDSLSGLTANPGLGVACDLLVGEGATVIMTETSEMLGAEHILIRRAADDQVAQRICEITLIAEANAKSLGVDMRGSQPTPGNINGGLTTLEEKSLGAIRKGGSSAIAQVTNFAEKPSQTGLIIMDGPSNDVVGNTGMIAAGAQMVVFTTGLGTPSGSPIAPVIKVSSNSNVYHRMQENIDLNAGTILDNGELVQSVGKRIFGEIINVASGKPTKAETLGHTEFAIHAIGPAV
jgi:altronate dehydratase large subunit